MKHRLLRVNELLKRELSTIITREITFDAVLVTVNQVDVTPDLKSAHVYISVFGSKGRNEVLPQLETNRAMLQADLVDEAALLRSPRTIGPEGIDAAPGFRRKSDNQYLEIDYAVSRSG